jgi:hypothetical protein
VEALQANYFQSGVNGGDSTLRELKGIPCFHPMFWQRAKGDHALHIGFHKHQQHYAWISDELHNQQKDNDSTN